MTNDAPNDTVPIPDPAHSSHRAPPTGLSTQGGNEADCLINEPGEENPPPPETTTLDDISNLCTKFGHLILRKVIKFVATRCQI